MAVPFLRGENRLGETSLGAVILQVHGQRACCGVVNHVVERVCLPDAGLSEQDKAGHGLKVPHGDDVRVERAPEGTLWVDEKSLWIEANGASDRAEETGEVGTHVPSVRSQLDR